MMDDEQRGFVRTYERRRPRRRRKNHFRTFAIIIIVMFVLLGVAAVCSKAVKDKNAEAATTTTQVTTTEPTTDEPEVTTEPSTTEQQKATEPETTIEPVTTEKVKDYDYSSQVPESAAVDESFFDDAVFVGNSRTDGFMMYCGLDNASFYAGTSITVRSAFTKPVVSINGKKLSIVDALKSGKQFKKVYVMLGLNEVGWPYDNVFIDDYTKLIQAIREAQPDAQIYVQSMLPVSAKVDAKGTDVNNKNIKRRNSCIREITKNEKVYFVNVYEKFVDASGCLPAKAAPDGVHLNASQCKIWLEYLMTHTVEE